MPFVNLINADQCPALGGVFVERGGLELAVFRLHDGFAVIDNTCPHAGGHLSAGQCSDGVVTCPRHEWRFDLSTGRCLHSPTAGVKSYRVQVRDGVVFADLPK